jgi:hypothetical protein
VTLSGLICNNYDVISVQKYPFLYPKKLNTTMVTYQGNDANSKMVYGDGNSILPCENFMGQIDFDKWKQK